MSANQDVSIMVEAYYELVQEIDDLKNRLYNRELALDYVRQVNPGLWGAMQGEFVFMNGYEPDAQYTREVPE